MSLVLAVLVSGGLVLNVLDKFIVWYLAKTDSILSAVHSSSKSHLSLKRV